LTDLFGFAAQANISDRTVDITTKEIAKPEPTEQKEDREKGLETANSESVPESLPARSPEIMQ